MTPACEGECTVRPLSLDAAEPKEVSVRRPIERKSGRRPYLGNSELREAWRSKTGRLAIVERVWGLSLQIVEVDCCCPVALASQSAHCLKVVETQLLDPFRLFNPCAVKVPVVEDRKLFTVRRKLNTKTPGCQESVLERWKGH